MSRRQSAEDSKRMETTMQKTSLFTANRPASLRVRITGAVVAAFALLLAPAIALAQACENPKVLRFSMIPTQESVRELTLYKPVIDLLAKNTGKKIEFYMPTSYSSVVEALLGKWVDVAMLGPESYVCLLYTSPSPRDRTRSRMPS